MAYTNFQHCTANEYKNIIYNQETNNKIKVLFNNVELEDADEYCESFEVVSRVIPNGSKIFMLENLVSQEATLVLHNIDTSIIQDQVSISIGTLVSENTYEYVPIGIYNLQEIPTTDNGKTTIKLRDNSVKLDFNYNAKPLIDQHGGTATKLQILQDICSQANITCNVSSFIGSTDLIGIYDNTITGRQYVAYLAGSAGAIPIITRSGALDFKYLNNLSTIEIPIEIVEQYSNAENFKISRVVYEDAIRKYESGNENYDTLFLDSANPYISSQEQVASIYNIVNNFEINSFKTGRILGNPAIDSYDLIQITDYDGTIFKTFANNTLRYNGKMINTFASEISFERKKENVSLKSGATFKKWAKTEIDNANAQITIQAGQIEEIEQDIQNPTSTKENKYFDLEDALDSPLIDFSLYGETQQDSTKGYQLLKNTNVNSGDNNYWQEYSTFDATTRTLTRSNSTTREKFIIHKLGGLKSNQQYTLSCYIKSNGYVANAEALCYNQSVQGVKVTAISNTYLTTSFKKFTWTFTTSSDVSYGSGTIIRFDNNSTIQSGTDAILTVKDVMLEEGNTAHDYEEFTNGSAPNPDYPQEIHNVSGDNTIEICGKNLFNKATITPNKYIDASGNLVNDNSNFVGDYIKIDNTKSYYLSASTVQPKRIGYYDSSKTFISRQLLSSGTGVALVIPNNAKYVRISNYNQDLDTTQLEKSSTASTYEAYTGQSQLISLGNIELCKIGTYQDYIYKESDRWFLHKEIGKVVLDGSESGDILSYSNNVLFFVTDNYLKNSEGGICYTSHFKGTANGGSVNTNLNAWCGNASTIAMMDTTKTSLAIWKTWLESNNVVGLYILKTPTDTEITDTTLLEQLNNLMTLPLYKNLTHITLTPNDLQPTMKIEYYRDTSINENFVPKEDMTKYYTKTETNAQIQISSSGIMSEVSRVDSRVDDEHKYALSVESTASTALTNSNLALEFKTEVNENGVKKVKTTTGFTFDENGLSITKEENFKNLMTDRNQKIESNGKEIMFMGYDDVQQKNVARIDDIESKRATIGVHRCETTGTGANQRTAWFYVGGGN